MPEEPQDRPQPPAVLRGLSARRERWRAEREARQSLFNGQTLAAERLLVVARVRAGARRLTWLLGMLLALHLLWRLSGLDTGHRIAIGLDWLLGPALGLLRTVAPDEPVNDPLSLVLLHLELLLCVIGLELAAIWMLRAWLYQRLPMLISASRALTQEQGPIFLEDGPVEDGLGAAQAPLSPRASRRHEAQADAGPSSADGSSRPGAPAGRPPHGRAPRRPHRRPSS